MCILRIAILVVFLLLGIYTIFAWVKPELTIKYNRAIRKTWYLLLIYGCSIYIAYDPDSLFSDWKSYIIVFVVFVVIDSMLFLTLYFSKFGNHELQPEETSIQTQTTLNETRKKIKSLSSVLNEHGFPGYNENEEELIQGLKELLNKYAEQESLVVELFPFETESEIEIILGTQPKKSKKKKILKKITENRTYYDSKDKLMIHPLTILNKRYVAKVTARNFNNVSDIDAHIINILYLVYYLAVDYRQNSSNTEGMAHSPE